MKEDVHMFVLVTHRARLLRVQPGSFGHGWLIVLVVVAVLVGGERSCGGVWTEGSDGVRVVSWGGWVGGWVGLRAMVMGTGCGCKESVSLRVAFCMYVCRAQLNPVFCRTVNSSPLCLFARRWVPCCAVPRQRMLCSVPVGVIASPRGRNSVPTRRSLSQGLRDCCLSVIVTSHTGLE